MLARRLFALLAVLLAASAIAQSTDTIRIEALDGGVVELGSVKQIISQQSKGIAILAEGAGSTVNLPALTDFAGMAGAPVSSLEARTGGTLVLNPVQTRLGNQVELPLDPAGSLSVGTLQLNPGSRLTGSGSLPGALINGGDVSPGDNTRPAGSVTVQGAYTQTAQGRLRIDLGGYTPGSDHDQLTSSGPLTLDGTLDVGVIGNFNPTAGSRFPFVTGSTRTGQFATTPGLTLPTGGTLQVEYDATTAKLAASGSGFPDGTGPDISDARVGTTPLANGLIISRPDTLSATATDPSAVARVEFYVDDTLLGTDTNGTDRYSAFWNIATLPDGAHTVRLVAYDTVNNPTTVTFSITVQLAAPPAPSIIAPSDGFVTNQANLTVLGTAAADAEILLQRNGIPAGGPFPVAANGGYRGTLTLQPGANTLQAQARNRAGGSPLSAPVGVMLDTAIPDPPIGLTAEGQAGGQIRLSWSVFNNSQAVSYEVYRASIPFTDIAQAVKANSSSLTATRFDDLPPADGVYYYRVISLNRAGNRSAPSVQASATADSIAPNAVRIDSTPTGAYDAATGRYGTGDIQIQVTVSEPLLTTPFLSLVPEGRAPVAITLSPVSETVYRGTVTVTPSMPSGTAYLVFSARDKVGNRGTLIETGDRLLLDTTGPAVSALSVTPADPIRNDTANPVTVQVRLTLSEAPKAGQPPALNYRLSASGRSIEPIPLTPLDTLNWQGSIGLPADAGQSQVETLEFSYQGVDDLGNVSTAIQAPYRFQVYQGELPPLGPPTGLKATALPQGRIQLQWQAVAKATDYQLYRQAPGESELKAYRRTDGALEWLDTPGVDGLYRYAVASVYQANTQEALSAPSAVVEVQADAVAPAAPRNLQLQLLSTGIQATWEAPADSATLHYNLYRAATPDITSVAGLTPLLSGLTGLSAVDANPSTTEHTYVVTALDPAGNESPPSNSVYFKPPRLPVASLSVIQQDTAAPVLTWSHPDTDLAGYDLYLGSAESGFKLNSELLTATTYTDTGYNGDERLYTVVAVGRDHVRSPGRSLRLPKLKVQAPAGTPVRRGLMNRVEYPVSNDSSQKIENATLQVRLGPHDQRSQPFTVAAGQTVQVPVVVGGYADLADLSPAETMLTLAPHPGEQAKIVRTGQLEVADGALLLQILTQEMTRGGAGKVRFGLENRGTAELEIVVAQAVGSAPSDDIRFTLVDNDGNVLATQPFQQGAGDGLIGLADGRTVVRIAPGGRFDSQWVDLPVPSAAPTQATVELTIDHVHYHLER